MSAVSPALSTIVSNPSTIFAQPDDAKQLKHHLKGGKGFTNPWPSFIEYSAPQLLWMMAKRRLTGQTRVPDTAPPTVNVRKPKFLSSRTTTKLRATWLGHACYYVEFPGGLRVLFDPVFEPCCAPIALPALKRYTPVPCEVEDIPIIDAVVISHSHYDHLSHPTVHRIFKKHPNVHFLVPLGLEKWFKDTGIKNVTELDWWHSKDIKISKRHDEKNEDISVEESGSSKDDVADTITGTIHALPCQHISGRGPFDRNQTLWASWSVESGGSNVYFAGDTGYRSVPQLPKDEDDYGEKYAHLPTCPAFKQIGQYRGPFDIGFIPIGAYDPRLIMSTMHANPVDSVNIFLDTNCKKALGMHWGTWVLTEEDVLEPPRILKKALSDKGIDEIGIFDVVDIGESMEFDSGKT